VAVKGTGNAGRDALAQAVEQAAPAHPITLAWMPGIAIQKMGLAADGVVQVAGTACLALEN
jgi:hypothetical protein